VQTPIKRCGHCGQEKTLDRFYKNKSSKDGVHGWCKNCADDARKPGTEQNERDKKHKRDSYRAKKNNPDFVIKTKIRAIRKRYRISHEEHTWLFSLKAGCWLCGNVTVRMNVDHDHAHCHKERKFGGGCRECIRGVLCFFCNRNFLPQVERYPHLQNEAIKKYLDGRPFKDLYGNNSVFLAGQL
jgi:hypothetical protein